MGLHGVQQSLTFTVISHRIAGRIAHRQRRNGRGAGVALFEGYIPLGQARK